MKIGTIDLGERPVLLAPMEDVTDAGFRLMCRRMGADMVYTEFASADAVIRMVPSTLSKMAIVPEERPAVVQIYGRDAATMAQAARIVAERVEPDILDLNFGCPVKRVAGKGGGAGMLQTPGLMLEITRAVVEAVPQLPVTVKTRLGWDSQHIIIGDMAPRLQDCGIKALTIHGRTRAQMYTGEADWMPIAAVKSDPRIEIPVIANGDIVDGDSAARCFEQTGADAVMVGRATFGAPWVFREIKAGVNMRFGNDGVEESVSAGGTNCKIAVADKVEILRQLVDVSIARLGEYSGILHSRRHLAATPIFKGIPNFRPLRIDMLRADNREQLFRLIDEAALMIPQQS